MDAPHPSCNPALAGDSTEGRRIRIGGAVQGVGFRPWVHRLAGRERVRGRVWNSSTGATIEAFGTADVLDRFVRLLSASAPPAARIEGIVCEAIPPEHLERFDIVRAGVVRSVGLRSRPISRLAVIAWPKFSIRPGAGIGTRSPTAPIAGRASRSRATFLTIGRLPRWRLSRCAPSAVASTKPSPIAASMPSPTRVPGAALPFASSIRTLIKPRPSPTRFAPPLARSQRAGLSQSRVLAGFTSPAMRPVPPRCGAFAAANAASKSRSP